MRCSQRRRARPPQATMVQSFRPCTRDSSVTAAATISSPSQASQSSAPPPHSSRDGPATRGDGARSRCHATQRGAARCQARTDGSEHRDTTGSRARHPREDVIHTSVPVGPRPASQKFDKGYAPSTRGAVIVRAVFAHAVFACAVFARAVFAHAVFACAATVGPVTVSVFPSPTAFARALNGPHWTRKNSDPDCRRNECPLLALN